MSPAATFLVIGPPWPTADPPAAVVRIRDALRYQAGVAGAVFVDPIAEHWFVGRPGLIGADGVHPTDKGHEYLADMIAPLIGAQLPRACERSPRSSLWSVIMGLAERLYELLTRVLSLRIIVVVAALSVVALVITLGAVGVVRASPTISTASSTVASIR